MENIAGKNRFISKVYCDAKISMSGGCDFSGFAAANRKSVLTAKLTAIAQCRVGYCWQRCGRTYLGVLIAGRVVCCYRVHLRHVCTLRYSGNTGKTEAGRHTLTLAVVVYTVQMAASVGHVLPPRGW